MTNHVDMRDLIRCDKERAEREALGRLKAELAHAYAVPESSYQPLTAAEVIARNRTRRSSLQVCKALQRLKEKSLPRY